MTLLIEHPYRGHSIMVGRDPDPPHAWTVQVWREGFLLADLSEAGEARALVAARQRVDLILDKPR